MPVKQSEAAMSPEQRRREVAVLLGLAVRRLVKRPGAGVTRPHADDAEAGRRCTLEHDGKSEPVNVSEHGAAPRRRPARPHEFPSRSPLDGAEDAGRDRPLPVAVGRGDDGGDR